MSHILNATNVNQAFKDALWWLRAAGKEERSRSGPVLVAPGTFQTQYHRPTERVLFNPDRDCNHVFHLMEAIWMFAGRKDVAYLLPFNSKYSSYADSGEVHGAYGWRWRNSWGDQLTEIVNVLRADRYSRQAVLQMWDYHEEDLTGTWKDRPCNTHAYFDLREGVLNMTVCCRSNDMLWGAYGANVVHFSMLQELLACALGVPVGVYRQFSNNFHVYTDLPMVKKLLDTPPADDWDLYARGLVAPIPLLAPREEMSMFLEDCQWFCDGKPPRTSFLRTVAVPLRDAYLARKAGQACDLRSIPHCDWKVGFEYWLKNRGIEK